MTDLACRVVSDLTELARLAPAWQALADRALESNPFYEPRFLLTMLQETGAYPGLEFWLVAPRNAPDQPLGVFPLRRRRVGPGGVVQLLSPFTRGRSDAREVDIDLGVPLIDSLHADAVLDALLDRLDRYLWPPLALDWFGLAADGAFCLALRARMTARRQPMLDLGGWRRAMFRPAADAQTYLAAVLSKRRAKDLAQSRRQIERQGGPISFQVLAPDADPSSWIDDYVSMEAGGWKGKEGTDIGADPGIRRFFTRSLTASHAAGRVMAYRLCAGSTPIAQTWVLFGTDRAVGLAWKMAYDDAYRKMSPGLLLQIEVIDLLHSPASPVQAIDSCATPGHPLWTWFWPDTRELAHLLVVPRTPVHRMMLSLLAARRQRRATRAAAGAGAGAVAEQEHAE